MIGLRGVKLGPGGRSVVVDASERVETNLAPGAGLEGFLWSFIFGWLGFEVVVDLMRFLSLPGTDAAALGSEVVLLSMIAV